MRRKFLFLFILFFLFNPFISMAMTTCPKVLPDEQSSISLNQSYQFVPTITSRIIGGLPSSSSTISYLVSLSYPNNTFACTGSLISRIWILTAAHCNPRLDWLIRVAPSRASVGNTISISTIYIHERYQPNRLDSPGDIALIKLKQPAPSHAIPILLLSNTHSPPSGAFARTAGYGRTVSNQPKLNPSPINVDAPINNPEKCRRIFHPALNIVQKWFLCVGYDPKANCIANTCLGDSGGPLIIYDHTNRPVQLGIVSFGSRCGNDGVPGVYVRIAPYIHWIQSKNATFRDVHNVAVIFAKGSKQAASNHTDISALHEHDQFRLQQHQHNVVVSKVIFVLICVILAIAVIALIFLSLYYVSSNNQHRRNSDNDTTTGQKGFIATLFAPFFSGNGERRRAEQSDAERITMAIDLLQTVVDNREKHQPETDQPLDRNLQQHDLVNRNDSNFSIPVPSSPSAYEGSAFDTASEGDGIGNGFIDESYPET